MVRITKSIAEERLGNVPQDKQFWCQDSRVLKNLQELEVALGEMSLETFRYHANDTRNDFSNWVRDVIGDEKLSRDISKCSDPSRAARVVEDRIIWLKNKVIA